MSNITLKDELKNFLKGDNKRPKKIKLDVKKISKNIYKIGDSKKNYFRSKNLAKLFRENKKEIPKEDFGITLYKWKFIDKSKTNSKSVDLDLEVDKYKIHKNSKIDFNPRKKDLLDYSEIKNLLETYKKKSNLKTPLKSKKIQTPLKSKKQTPKKKLRSVKEDKIVEPKKKIKKNKKSARSSIKAISIRSRRTPLKKFFEDETIAPEDILSAPEYGFNNRKTSVTNPRGLSGSKRIFRDLKKIEKTVLKSPSKKKFVKSLKKFKYNEKNEYGFEEIEEMLKNEPIEFEDILNGVKNGWISWDEILMKKDNINFILFSEDKL